MKRKYIFFFVFLFSLSLITTISNTFAQTSYEYKIQEGDEFIYVVTEADQDNYFGSGFTVGDKEKIEVVEIEEYPDYFRLDYYRWSWIGKGESFDSDPDDSDYTRLYKDPSETSISPFYFVLTPVDEFLAEFAEANYDYTSDGNKLTDISFHLTETFDSNGVLSKTEKKTGDIIVYAKSRTEDSSSSSSIPGYEFPIFIGTIVVVGVSMTYFTKRKICKKL